MRKCSVDGCENKHKAQGYCNKHYQQMKKNGKVSSKTIYDLNEIVEHEDYAEIILYNKDGKEKARTLIDLDDVGKVKNYRWGLTDRDKYVEMRRPRTKLHRFIMDCPDDMVVDHINGDGLDNRKSNLRICTQAENTRNHSKPCNNTSGYIGVSYGEPYGKWHAYITYNGRRITLGYYDTIVEAAEARRQAEIEYFGEYRKEDEDWGDI